MTRYSYRGCETEEAHVRRFFQDRRDLLAFCEHKRAVLRKADVSFPMPPQCPVGN